MDSPSDRLAIAMEQRRLELDLAWKDLASAAKVSVATLGAIRRGVNEPSALNKRRLENALRWEHGSIEAILTGGEPTTVADAADSQAPEGEHQDPLVAELAQQLEQLKAEAARNREENNEIRKLLKQITGKDPNISGGEEPESEDPGKAM